jgi:hypothetical protein
MLQVNDILKDVCTFLLRKHLFYPDLTRNKIELVRQLQLRTLVTHQLPARSRVYLDR